MNYYERHIGDYLKDTSHLSLLEHGVYARLLDVYYTREGAIPDLHVARLVGAKSKDELSALRSVLDEFFVQEPDAGCWTQMRCEREITRYQDKQRKAKASAEARWSHAERNANAMRTHSEGNADGMHRAPVPRHQTPDTIPKEKKAPLRGAPTCPDDVSPQVWADWLRHRKEKRASVTETVITGARKEAGKAGMTFEAFLAVWCRRGSQGLEASWLQPDERAPQVAPMTTGSKAPDQTAAYLESQRQTPEQRAASDAARRETMAKLRKVA